MKAAPVTLIVEPHAEGHRLSYVALLINECRSKGAKPIVFTTKPAVESVEWDTHIGDLDPQCVFGSPDEFTLRTIADVAARVGARVTVIPEADGHLVTAATRGWSGPGTLNLLIMRATAQPASSPSMLLPAKTTFKQLLVAGADFRRNIQAFVLRSPVIPGRGRLRWLPEPVEFKATPQQVQALRSDLDASGPRYWFGVFGAIAARKNLPLIVEALPHQSNIGLVIAGAVQPAVSNAAAPLLENFVAHGGKVVCLSGTITDAEFDSAIGAVDCVVAAHSNEGPSAVVLKAVVSGRRLALAGAESLRQDAIRLGDQASWSPLSASALRDALGRACRLPQPSSGREFGVEEFVTKLTSEQSPSATGKLNY